MAEQDNKKRLEYKPSNFLFKPVLKPVYQQNSDDLANQMKGIKNNPDATAEQLLGACQVFVRAKSDCEYGLDKDNTKTQ